MNEIDIAIGRRGDHLGYQRVMANPNMGDFGKFLPGAGTSMGYDDLKVIECRKFIESYLGLAHTNSNIHDAVAAARVVSAIEKSAETGQWIDIAPVAGTTSAKK
jgi:predicted dehydrogenase